MERKTVSNKVLRDRIIFFVVLALALFYLGWRALFSLPFGTGFLGSFVLFLGVLLFCTEVLDNFQLLVQQFALTSKAVPPLPEVPDDTYPEIDIFITTIDEPAELLSKTVNGCKYLHYPDIRKLRIHLLDDGRRPEIRELAQQLGINYLSREESPGERDYSSGISHKALMLNYALANTSAPLVVTLNADTLPLHNFLLKTVPYFIENQLERRAAAEAQAQGPAELGFVQTASSSYNPDVFQYNLFSEKDLPSEQDFFNKQVQIAHNTSNSVIYCGTSAVLRRSALEAIDGFYTELDADGLGTGILLQKKGYRCLATNEALSNSYSPANLHELLKKRARTAREYITTGSEMRLFTSSSLSVAQRLNYLAAIAQQYAPLKRFAYFLAPILFSVFGITVLKMTLPDTLIFWLPFALASSIASRLFSDNVRSTELTAQYEVLLFSYLMGAVLRAFFGLKPRAEKTKSPAPTPAPAPEAPANAATALEAPVATAAMAAAAAAAAPKKSGGSAAQLIPLIVIAFFSLLGIILLAQDVGQPSVLSRLVVLIWLLVNLYYVALAVLFVLGRTILRADERVATQLECELFMEGRAPIPCISSDFSEQGIALAILTTEDINPDDTVDVRFSLNDYHVRLKGQVLRVDERTAGWKYVLRILDYYDSFSDYLQVLYDRIPAFPSTPSIASNPVSTLFRTIKRRLDAYYTPQRTLPRFDIDETYALPHGRSVHITNYNFKYLVTDTEGLPRSFEIHPAPDLLFRCHFERTLHSSAQLYRVQNYQELHSDAEKSEKLRTWITTAMTKARQA